MFSSTTEIVCAAIVAVLTWVIVMLGVARLARFYADFKSFRRDLDAHLFGVEAQLKKLQSTFNESLVEQRKAVRTLNEQLALQQAAMTGEYDIVEEPVLPTPETPSPEPVRKSSAPLPKIN
ncbi:MAG: hypothetical protein PHI35_03845 [Victivallaceae bacterium]|nr:hypothetical protein [Victivallaceae bacterium]